MQNKEHDSKIRKIKKTRFRTQCPTPYTHPPCGSQCCCRCLDLRGVEFGSRYANGTDRLRMEFGKRYGAVAVRSGCGTELCQRYGTDAVWNSVNY